MKKPFLTAVLALGAVASLAQTPPQPTVLKVDLVHSVVGFSVHHLVSRVTGNFTNFTGTITVPDPAKPELFSVSFTIEAVVS